MTAYKGWLEVALVAAEEAGAYLRRVWRTEHAVQVKGFRDIVTAADFAVEEIILSRLRAAFPDHAITSEEAGADAEKAGVRWLVDPLDGTTNFSRNNPNFCSSIAAVDQGIPVVGVVYDPLRAHAFAACAGGGATLNGEALSVSGITDVQDAVVSIDSPKEPQLRQQLWAYAGRFLSYGRTLRASGAAALNIAYIAAGWTDGYFSTHLKPWDQAAGVLIVQEAGGVVGTLSGEPWTPYTSDPLVAASHELLLGLQQILGVA